MRSLITTIQKIGLIFIICRFASTIVTLTFYVLQGIHDGTSLKYWFSTGIAIVTLIFPIAYYPLQKKYEILNYNFSFINLIVFIIGGFEQLILLTEYVDNNGFLTTTSLVVALSICSCSLKKLIAAYVILDVYVLIRSWFYINNTVRYIRFNMNVTFMLVFTFFLSRTYQLI